MTRIGVVTATWPGEGMPPTYKMLELCFRLVIENGHATLGTWRAIGRYGDRVVFQRIS